MIAALVGLALSAHPADWKTYARCAAAYQVNAGIPDPDRPSTMKAQVDETAQDYRRAALARRRLGKAARPSVDAEIRRRAAEFAHMPREAVEKGIDICPQLPERP